MNDLLKITQDNYAYLTKTLIEKNISITTMESCTSGLVASFITDIDNSSKVFKGSFVTYSNEAKQAIGVSKDIIDTYGVYSSQTAIEMAKTCRKRYKTNIGIGVTGSLGIIDPNNSDSKPGEVYFAFDINDKIYDYFINIENCGSKFLNKVFTANQIYKELIKLI